MHASTPHTHSMQVFTRAAQSGSKLPTPVRTHESASKAKTCARDTPASTKARAGESSTQAAAMLDLQRGVCGSFVCVRAERTCRCIHLCTLRLTWVL